MGCISDLDTLIIRLVCTEMGGLWGATKLLRSMKIYFKGEQEKRIYCTLTQVRESVETQEHAFMF